MMFKYHRIMRTRVTKLSLLALGFLFTCSQVQAQLIPNGAYLIGNQVEVGIHNHGHEGAPDLPGSNSRTNSTSAVYLGFVANPQNDGWVDYDGDFFTPGTPENGFGIEINGVNYSNNGATPSFGILQYQIPGSFSNYQQDGNCISVQWDGSVNNVGVKLVYSLNITEVYYTTEVTITNNTAATLTDVYYYRNLDPDNNQSINMSYETQNTIVAQPTPGCEKALVSATQSFPWPSYIGLGAVGPNFRVSYGGFANRDGSNIWNGVGFTSAVGASSSGDVAISLAYKISSLAVGASETFQFGVILDQNQIDAAIASFYYFDYSGGTGVPDVCEPEVDTVITCAGIPTTISVEGPNTSAYNWAWTPPTDLSVTTGSTTNASPNSTTTYTVTGTPVGGGCIAGTITKQIVVDLAAGPEIQITDPGQQCGSFDLTTLIVTDINSTPGTTTEFFGVVPDSATQVAGIWPSNLITSGDVVYVMIADPSTGCFAVQQVIIDFGGSGSAGSDSTFSLCNVAGTTFDLDNYLSAGVAGTGVWSETTIPASGQFNTSTAVLNANGLAGTYTFNYFVAGQFGCPDDNAVITINLFAQPVADFEYIVNGQSSADGLTSACITNLITFDNNSTVTGGGSSITTNTWTYDDGNGSSLSNPTYLYSSPGTYDIVLTVETNQGCVDTYTMPITITNIPTMALNIGEPSCYQFTDGSITINTSGGGPYTYIISNSAGTQINTTGTNTVNNIGSGWYYLNVDDGAGCAGIDSVFVSQPDQIDIDLIVNQPLCYGFNTGSAIVDTVYNHTGSYNDISYFWNPNPNGTNGIGQNTSTQLGPGTYTLNINDISGCSQVFDFVIAYPDSLYFVELGVEPAYCRTFDFQSGHGVVYAAASGSGQNDSYLWTNLTTGATTANTTWGGLNPGQYQIVYTNSNGCTITETLTVEELDPIADFEMTSPQFTSDYYGTAPVEVHFINESQYYANENDPNADTTFFWHFGIEGEPWIYTEDFLETYDRIYTEGGIYEVCLAVITYNNCKDTMCKNLVIYDPLIFIPVNIFSPDGDGINDSFTFRHLSQAVSEFSCLIVNRWGTKITEMDDITDEWDGTDMSGDKCADGVYFYTYTGTADDGTPFEGQGTIQLINSKK